MKYVLNVRSARNAEATVGPFVFSSAGSAGKQRGVRDATSDDSGRDTVSLRGTRRTISVSSRNGIVVHCDPYSNRGRGGAVFTGAVDSIARDLIEQKDQSESERVITEGILTRLVTDDDCDDEDDCKPRPIVIVSLRPSEDVCAIVLANEIEFYDVCNGGTMLERNLTNEFEIADSLKDSMSTGEIKQFCWESDETFYVIIQKLDDDDKSALYKNTGDIINENSSAECVACHPKTKTLAYACDKNKIIVGEDEISLNDVDLVESIAFPNETNDCIVLVSTCNTDGDCDLVALRKESDGAWTASKLGGGFDINPTQEEISLGNPLHVVPIQGWDVALCAHARAWDNQVLIVSTSASDPIRVLEIEDDKCYCTIPLAFDDEDNFVAGIAVDYGASCGAMINPSDGGAGDLPLGPTVLVSTADGRIACYRLACLKNPPGFKIEKIAREAVDRKKKTPQKMQGAQIIAEEEVGGEKEAVGEEKKVVESTAPPTVKNLWSSDFLAKNKAHQAKVQESIEEEEKPKSVLSFALPASNGGGDKPVFNFGTRAPAVVIPSTTTVPSGTEKPATAPAFSFAPQLLSSSSSGNTTGFNLFGVPSTPPKPSSPETKISEEEKVPPTPIPDPTPPRPAPPPRITTTPLTASTAKSFEPLADDPTELLEQLSLGKVSDVAAAREKLKQLFLKEHEIETTPKRNEQGREEKTVFNTPKPLVKRDVDVTKIIDDAKALTPMDPKASPLPTWGKKLEAVPKTSAARASAAKDIISALRMIETDFENAKLECDAMLSDCTDACDAIQNENSVLAASALFSKKHYEILTKARDSAREEIQETKRVVELQNEAIGELWARDRINETMRCELESLIDDAKENLHKNQTRNPEDEDSTEFVDLDVELPPALRKLKNQLRREMDAISHGAADFEVRTNLVEREKKRIDRIKKAAGNSNGSNSALNLNQGRSDETTRALKAAVETQKEVIDDQNERLEATIADLREFGYDADVRLGKNGRVEVNGIETPGKQRLAALSSGVLFSTPRTAVAAGGRTGLSGGSGSDIPTTCHTEAIDRAIRTLVKQPRVVISEMKRDVLKEPLRRVEPRLPPKRIERTISAPVVVKNVVEVPPPAQSLPAAAAAKAPLFPPMVSGKPAVVPATSTILPAETAKIVEVPPPPTFSMPSLSSKKIEEKPIAATAAAAAGAKPLFPSFSAPNSAAAAAAAAPEVKKEEEKEKPEPNQPVNLWGADFMAKNKADQAKIQVAIEKEEGKPTPAAVAFNFAPPATSDAPKFNFGIAKEQPKKEEPVVAPTASLSAFALASKAPPAVKPLLSTKISSSSKRSAFGSDDELNAEGKTSEEPPSSPPQVQRAARGGGANTAFSFGSSQTLASSATEPEEEGETSVLETPKISAFAALPQKEEKAPVADFTSSLGSFGGFGLGSSSTTSTVATTSSTGGGVFGSTLPTSSSTVSGAPSATPAFGGAFAPSAVTSSFSKPPTSPVVSSTFGNAPLMSQPPGGAATLTGTPGFGQAAKIGGIGGFHTIPSAVSGFTTQSSFGGGGAAALTGTPKFGQSAKIGGSPSSPAPTTFGTPQSTAFTSPSPGGGFAAFANKPTGFGAVAASGGGFGALAASGGGFGAVASASGGGGNIGFTGFGQAAQQQQQQQQQGGFGQSTGFGQSAGFGQQQRGTFAQSPSSGFGQQQQQPIQGGFGGQATQGGFGQNTALGAQQQQPQQGGFSGQSPSGFGQQQQKPPMNPSAFTQMRR